MAKVFLHLYESPGSEPENLTREFLRLPLAGEFLTPAPNAEWYKVTLVVHCPFDDSHRHGSMAAELYAHRVDSNKVLKEHGPWRKGAGLRVPRDE